MNIIGNIEFLNKGYFVLILLIPLLIYFFYKKDSKGINFLYFGDVKKVYKTNSKMFYIKYILLILILINFVIILANPNTTNVSEKVKKNGIDIVIALDISGSMDAEDLKPSRIEAAKK
ncbi:aerotolerance regulator BatA, partial [Candidatus Gracilibacteria bacterium]|nr:aerotolerance regulator BatA [Candidatus Gracilibacteria bacterium]